MSVKTVDVSAKSIEEAFDQSGINWIAEQSEMLNTATGKIIEGKKVIYRSDNQNQIGVVGSKYGILQNLSAFSFFDTICEKNGASICKVSEYNGGSTIHLEAEVKDKKFDAKVGDEVGFRFNLWNDFSGLRKATVSFGALRLICKNGLVAMGKEASHVEIRHTKNAVLRFDEAVRVWGAGEIWYNKFTDNVKILTDKIVTTKMVDKFLNDLFGESDSGVNQRKKDSVANLFEHGMGNHGKTAWDLLNGTTEWVDWHSKKNSDDLMEFANIGAGYNLKAKAFDLVMMI